MIQDVCRTFKGQSVFFYLDPPFWAKADQLYRFSFSGADHERLASALRYVQEPYLLSYDAAPAIEKLHARHGCMVERVELLYTAT